LVAKNSSVLKISVSYQLLLTSFDFVKYCGLIDLVAEGWTVTVIMKLKKHPKHAHNSMLK